MVSLKKMVLSAVMAAGLLGVGTTQAKAAVVGVYVGGPVAYVPPCPGTGYVWVAPYRVGGYWYPGRWNYVGVRGPVVVDRFHGGFYARGGYRFRR
jgi:hypothetical protein